MAGNATAARPTAAIRSRFSCEADAALSPTFIFDVKVLRHVCVTRVVAPEEISAEIDVCTATYIYLSLIQPRDRNTYIYIRYAGLRCD